MNEVLVRQMAADYCCTETQVADRENHYTVHRFLEGRRRYEESSECFLKVAAVNGKLLFTGAEPIIEWCRNQYKDSESAWFFEADVMRPLNDRLHEDGYEIKLIHPFFISEKPLEMDVPDDLKIRWYEGDEIDQFRSDTRFNKAYTFDKDAPDVLGVGALDGNEIIGMAGASLDSPTMWQIGINVVPQARRHGTATILVSLLRNEILRRGILPYYGTAVSHVASLRVAVGAGFIPAWTELSTGKISG